MVTAIEMTHVPYRGSAPALSDLVSGRLDVMFDNLISATPFIQSGDLRALGMTSPERRASMPEVPTLKELGYGVVVLSWAGIFAPAGTPQTVIDYLSEKMNVVSAMPDYRAQLETLGVEPQTMTPAALRAFTASEIDKFAKVVAASGASAD